MVQILIEQAENSTELILIELQGALNYFLKYRIMLLKNNHYLVNVLAFSFLHKMQDMPVCVIGQHVLDGKMVELDKPLLVMRKRQADGTNNTSYQVECVIKRKLLFHKRSKSIVHYSSKKM
ncbi:unnamed protein product [Rotaria socialis]